MVKFNNTAYRLSLFLIGTYIMVALFSPFLAGDKPIMCKSEDAWIFPFLSDKMLKNYNAGSTTCIMPLIPYSGGYAETAKNYGMSPFAGQKPGETENRHWLGTDKLGRDVAAGMIRGCGIALKIGFLSVFFSFLIGVSLGMAAGYFQDKGIKINAISMMIYLTGLVIIGYMIWMEFVVFRHNLFLFFVMMIGLILVLKITGHLWAKYSGDYKISIPLDTILVKSIEIRKSFPGIFLLLALISVCKVPSVWNIVLIITLLSWADFARLARGDTLSVKSENYITSATVLGMPDVRIIFRHILPNIMPTLIVAVCFSIGSAVILESTLSFLGVGLPVEEVSWGKMLAEGRNMRYWWLVVFPGLAIFLMVLSLNNISNHWQKSNFSFRD
jgi:peptide/nickel transport system permease protein